MSADGRGEGREGLFYGILLLWILFGCVSCGYLNDTVVFTSGLVELQSLTSSSSSLTAAAATIQRPAAADASRSAEDRHPELLLLLLQNRHFGLGFNVLLRFKDPLAASSRPGR